MKQSDLFEVVVRENDGIESSRHFPTVKEARNFALEEVKEDNVACCIMFNGEIIV